MIPSQTIGIWPQLGQTYQKGASLIANRVPIIDTGIVEITIAQKTEGHYNTVIENHAER